MRPEGDLPSLKNAAYVVYSDTTVVSAVTGTSRAIVEKPYFNRTLEHFCSHKHAPASGEKYGDAVVLTDNTAYISHRIFTEYFGHGTIYAKEVVRDVIARLLGDEISVRTNLPAQGVLTLTEKEDALLVHTLYASPVRRGENVEIIEDLVTLCDIKVSLDLPTDVTSATLRPSGKTVPLTVEDGRVTFTLDRLHCSEIVELK